MFQSQELKVGDKVILKHYSYLTKGFERKLVFITKITPKGFIKVDDERVKDNYFKPTGECKGYTVGHYSLENFHCQWLTVRFAVTEHPNWNKLTESELLKIYFLLESKNENL